MQLCVEYSYSLEKDWLIIYFFHIQKHLEQFSVNSNLPQLANFAAVKRQTMRTSSTYFVCHFTPANARVINYIELATRPTAYATNLNFIKQLFKLFWKLNVVLSFVRFNLLLQLLHFSVHLLDSRRRSHQREENFTPASVSTRFLRVGAKCVLYYSEKFSREEYEIDEY